MTIARDWNTRSVPGASDRPWTAPTLRKALLCSRMAGLREHGIDLSGRTLGDLSPAVWAAALDRQTWDQVRAVLLNFAAGSGRSAKGHSLRLLRVRLRTGDRRHRCRLGCGR